jgi:hypothetical protein
MSVSPIEAPRSPTYYPPPDQEAIIVISDSSDELEPAVKKEPGNVYNVF